MHYLVYSFIISVLAGFGFLIASFIRGKVTKKDSLVCPLNSDCDAVVHSRHNKFLRVPVTTWGMIYYGIIFVGYVLLLGVPPLAFPGITFLLLIASIIAFVFSLYLVAVQGYVLRQWCTWCLVSAAVSTLILVLAFLRLESLVFVLLAYFRILIFMAYFFGVMMGVGGSIIYTVLFFKFLRDLKLSSAERETLTIIANVVIVGLGIVLVAGLGLYVPMAGFYAVNAEFMVAAIIGAVLVIQTIMVKTDVVHQLSDLYDNDIVPSDSKHAYLRKQSYALGAVGLVSWIALGLVSVINFRMSFLALASLYVLVIIIAVLWSQLSEYKVYRRSHR